MVYPMNILEHRFGIFNTNRSPVQVHHFPGVVKVNFWIDDMKHYDPDYNNSTQRKSLLNKITLELGFFNITDHFVMTQYKIGF